MDQFTVVDGEGVRRVLKTSVSNQSSQYSQPCNYANDLKTYVSLAGAF